MIIISVFALSDLHLSLGTDKPMDIFKGWHNYVERIDKNWKRTVTENDTVIIPGDISWALKLEDCVADFEYLNSLPGKKIILKGNHDLWWSTVRKMNDFLTLHGFDTISLLFNNSVEVEGLSICGSRGWFFDEPGTQKVILREAGRLRMSLSDAEKSGNEKCVFLHYPPVYNGEVCREIIDVLHEFNITRVYHGHIHGGSYKFATDEFEGIKFKLISCDCVDFCPVLIKK